MKAFDYLILPFMLLALFAGAEIYLMTKPMEGNAHLYYDSNGQRIQDTRLSVETFSSQVKLVKFVIVLLSFFFSFHPKPQMNWRNRLRMAAVLFNFGMNFIFSRLLMYFLTKSSPDPHHPYNVVPEVTFIISSFSFALIKEIQSSGSHPLLIKTIFSGSAAAMLVIGFLAMRFYPISLFDLIVWVGVGIYSGWMVIERTIPNRFRHIIGVNLNDPRKSEVPTASSRSSRRHSV